MAKIHYMCECCGEREADAVIDIRTGNANVSTQCMRENAQDNGSAMVARIISRRTERDAQWAHRCQSMTRHPTEGMLLNCELQSHEGHHGSHRHGGFNWSHEGDCGERHESGRLCTLNGLHAGPHLSLSKEGEIGSPAWEEPLPVWLSHVVSKFTGESAQIMPGKDGGFTISIAERSVGIRAELLERRDPQRVFWHLRACGFRRAERGGDAPGPSLAEWFMRTAVELLNGAQPPDTIHRIIMQFRDPCVSLREESRDQHVVCTVKEQGVDYKWSFGFHLPQSEDRNAKWLANLLEAVGFKLSRLSRVVAQMAKLDAPPIQKVALSVSIGAVDARAAMVAADVEMRAKTDRHARSLAARQREVERALRLDAWANRQVPPPRQTSPARGAVAPGHPPSWPSQEGEEP